MGEEFEHILFNNKTIMKFAVQENALCVFYAIEMNGQIKKLNVQKVTSKKHLGTPCICRIKNSAKLDNANSMIEELVKKFGLKK